MGHKVTAMISVRVSSVRIMHGRHSGHVIVFGNFTQCLGDLCAETEHDDENEHQ